MEIELSADFTLGDNSVEYLNNKPFNNRRWREIIAEAVGVIDEEGVGLSVISPWGFELTEDRSFLSKNLRRFYCYIGVPNKLGLDKQRLADEFYCALMQILRQCEPSFYEEIVIAIEQDCMKKLRPNNYQCKFTDKLIDVQVRYVDKDIILDYAKYVILSIASILELKAECRNYLTNRVHRARMFQIYVMVENLFGYVSPFSNEQKKQFKLIFKFTGNMIQQFYTGEFLIEPIEAEKSIIEKLIIPRVSLLKKLIREDKGRDEQILLKGAGYHCEDQLSLEISKKLYDSAVNKICQTYINFV